MVETPAFMSVGTQGSVKCVTPHQVAETGCQVVLANTYHMSLHQRTALVERHGGLHNFMHWDKTILTDSGGFQVFSLPGRVIEEEGVTFTFNDEGEKVHMTPESSMDTQRRLGADIVMAFDECVEYPAPREYVEASVDRTHRWLQRCAKVELAPHQNLFGIIQGGVELDLRTRSTEQVCSVDCPGYAIGGVSVGEGLEWLERVVGHTAPLMPKDKPRYLMGVGLPEDLVSSVERGMDMFDCVIPPVTHAKVRHLPGMAKCASRIKNSAKTYPLDTNCDCYVCKKWVQPRIYSSSYVRQRTIG